MTPEEKADKFIDSLDKTFDDVYKIIRGKNTKNISMREVVEFGMRTTAITERLIIMLGHMSNHSQFTKEDRLYLAEQNSGAIALLRESLIDAEKYNNRKLV